MSFHLQSLPEELIIQVLGYLPKFDIKSARLTCSQIARTGAQWLFQRIYFAPRKSAIETFLNISSNPVFAWTVTELVYDGRLFLPELANYKSYKQAFDDFRVHVDLRVSHVNVASVVWRFPGAPDYHESLANSLASYTRYLEQQRGLFEKQDDYQALCAGLKNLPNISTVIVLDNFSECNGYVPLRTDDHSWYHRRSQCEIALAVRPSSWYPSMSSIDKCDVRGIQHLIRALSQHGNHVVQLHIASETWSAPLSIFGNQYFCDDAYRMVRRLELLKVHLFTNEIYSAVELSEQGECLNSTLSEAKNLRCLAIGGQIDINVLKNKVWPHLETLYLGDIRIQANELKEIIQAQKDTLREVSFRNIQIAGDQGWAHVAEQVGKYLRLRKISFFRVTNDVPRHLPMELEPEEVEAVARSFMQSIHRITRSFVTVITDMSDPDVEIMERENTENGTVLECFADSALLHHSSPTLSPFMSCAMQNDP